MIMEGTNNAVGSYKYSNLLIKTNSGWVTALAFWQKIDGEWQKLRFFVFKESNSEVVSNDHR